MFRKISALDLMSKLLLVNVNMSSLLSNFIAKLYNYYIFIFIYSQTTLGLFVLTLTLDKLLRDLLILPGKINL